MRESCEGTEQLKNHTLHRKQGTYPRLEVHRRPSVEQQRRHVDVAIVSSNMERSKAALRGTRRTHRRRKRTFIYKRKVEKMKKTFIMSHEQSMMGLCREQELAKRRPTEQLELGRG